VKNNKTNDIVIYQNKEKRHLEWYDLQYIIGWQEPANKIKKMKEIDKRGLNIFFPENGRKPKNQTS